MNPGYSVQAILLSILISSPSADILTKTRFETNGFMGLAALKTESEVRQTADKRDERSRTWFTGAMMKLLSGKKGMEARSITRLDKELVWSLNPKEKEYTELTFKEQKEMVEQGIAQMQGQPAQDPTQQRSGGSPYKSAGEPTVEVEKTGKTFEVSGFKGKQVIATMRMPFHDSVENRVDTLVMKYDAYLSDDGALEKELGAFNKSYAQKMKMDLDHFRGLEALYRSFEKPMTKLGKQIAKEGDVPLKFSFTIMKPAPPKKERTATAGASSSDDDGGSPGIPTSLEDAAGKALGSAFGMFKKKKEKEKEEKQQAQRAEQGIPDGWIVLNTSSFEYSEIKMGATEAADYELPKDFKKVDRAGAK